MTTAIIPAYNEEGRVGATVRALVGAAWVDEVVVVDDGSFDGTRTEAMGAGARVISLQSNAGKGVALNRGLEVVHDDLYVFADADLGTTAVRLEPLVSAVSLGRADMAVAAFDVPGGFGLAKGIARYGVRRLTGRTFRAPLSGQRALTRQAALSVLPLPQGWGVEVAMTVRALWQGLRVIEVPIRLEHRQTGKDMAGFLHRGRQCAAIMAALWRLWRKVDVMEART